MLRRNSSIGEFHSSITSLLLTFFQGMFHEDDEFMGNFDEDGSFIGDYTHTSPEDSQAVQNKLLAFANMYRKA